ncbi:unnamed protein product [Nippostrongylus brasiliensis]|uniref:Transposase n=1 Tax=Nippostrongylus brasiliensis TaxID=27835 RepID=A0A0N4XJ60_NIPBR|nr:unnamed protein product [Nippostrongylus brasiliensis]
MASESLRVEQVDANILDVEYRQLMERQLELIITELPVTASRICERLKPEIQLLIDGILWTSRAYRGASPGQIEMDIAYKGYNRGKIFLHFFLSVFLSYITKRVASILGHTSAQRILLKTAALMEVR